MRLVLNSRNCNANAGLNRFKGEGIYQALGRKHTGLRKVETDEADKDDMGKETEGEGVDAADSNIEKHESDEESSIETISNFTEDEPTTDCEIDKNDKEDVGNDNQENGADKVNLKRKIDEEACVEQKYPPSIVDFLINHNTDDSPIPIPTKLQCLQNGEMNDEKSTKHELSLIYPTKTKKWPQKKCVHCRRNYGLRKDTRYRCLQCDVPLCKEPCFADYHCNK